MHSKELIKLLKQNGWQKVSQKGSHLKIKKGNQVEIIPVHNKDIPIGTVKAILKRTGLNLLALLYIILAF